MNLHIGSQHYFFVAPKHVVDPAALITKGFPCDGGPFILLCMKPIQKTMHRAMVSKVMIRSTDPSSLFGLATASNMYIESTHKKIKTVRLANEKIPPKRIQEPTLEQQLWLEHEASWIPKPAREKMEQTQGNKYENKSISPLPAFLLCSLARPKSSHPLQGCPFP